jgi:hypothetical protein
MQAEAGHGGAAWAGQRVQTLGIDLVPGAGHAPPGVGTVGHSSRDGCRVETRQPGFIAAQRIGLFRVRFRTHAAALEQGGNTLGQGGGQAGDFIIFGSHQGLKLGLILIIGGVDAIQGEHMEVEVEIQAPARTLNEGDGAALRVADGVEFDGAAREGTQNRIGKDVENGGHQFGVVGQAVT